VRQSCISRCFSGNWRFSLVCLAAMVFTGCGAGTPTRSASTPTAIRAQSPNPPPSCPVPEGGSCLGRLAAGTYRTESFHPKLTYRVPNGWSNYEDLAGNFLLMPPGAGPPGNFIASDFISVATSVAAQGPGCRGQPAPGVGTKALDIVAWMSRQRALLTSGREPVVIGGLHGEALDIRMKPGAKGCLSPGAPNPAVPLVVGTGASSFDHEIGPGVRERDYLLKFAGGALGIEVIDTSGGSHLDSYATIVKSFGFGT
jgi:hypothetical protein